MFPEFDLFLTINFRSVRALKYEIGDAATLEPKPPTLISNTPIIND